MKTPNFFQHLTLFSVIWKSWFLGIFLVSFTLPLLAQDGGEISGGEGQTSYPDLTPAGFLQTHFSADDVADNPANFSIHRARMGFTGNLSENIRLNLIIGATEPPNNTPALVNAFADFTLDPLFNLRAGQFFAPFGLEGPEPITRNPAIERAFSTRRMNPFTMFRDIGVMAYGEHSIFSYSVAVMNGNGANVPEGSNSKEIVGRVDIEALDNLMAGISAHLGTYKASAFDRLARQRWGFHAEYLQSPIQLRGEFFVRDREITPDNRAQTTGGYLLAKYEISEKWEAIGRYDHFGPENEGDPYQGFTLGPNYQIGKNTQLSLNGILYTPVNDDAMQYLLNIQLQMVL